MSSSHIDSTTGRNVLWGTLVGVVAGFVPIVSLFAPLLAGGVAGYLERAGAKRGVVVGALTGLVVAVVGSLVTLAIAVSGIDFGSLGSLPGTGLLVGGALWVVAAVGQVTVSALGGGLGALVEADRDAIAERFGPDAETTARSRMLAALVGVSAALLTFVVVGFSVTALLDPYIWPSMVVGIPAGAVAGTAVGVLAFHALTTRLARAGGRTPGTS